MNLPNALSIVLLLLGSIATLAAAWQLYKRGLITWVIVLIIGITAINYGLTTKASGMDDFLDQINAGKFSRFSQEKLKEACDSMYQGK